MTERQDPDIIIYEVYNLRGELVYMAEVFNDDRVVTIVLEGLTD